MRKFFLAALTILLSHRAFADCPAVSISCGFHGTGTFSPSCTGDFTIGDSTVTYPQEVFTISPPVGEALGASVTTSAFGSAIFLLDAGGKTLDDSVDSFSNLETLTSAVKITAAGTYSIYIANPDSPSGVTYVLDVSCDAIPALVDHTMAKSVNATTGAPNDRTMTFGSADEGATSWIEVGATTGFHHVVWSFVEPAGSVWSVGDTGIGGTGSFPGFYAWSELFLIHHPAGLLPGMWTVNVALDGQPLVTEHFTLLLQSMRPQVEGLTAYPIGPRHGR